VKLKTFSSLSALSSLSLPDIAIVFFHRGLKLSMLYIQLKLVFLILHLFTVNNADWTFTVSKFLQIQISVQSATTAMLFNTS